MLTPMERENTPLIITLCVIIILLAISSVVLLVMNKNLTINLTLNNKEVTKTIEAQPNYEKTGEKSAIELIGNDNFVNFAIPEAKYVDLAQGKYLLSLQTNYNYALGYDFANNNKVVVSAVTNGLPNGHVWVLEKDKPLAIDLYDYHSPDQAVRLWTFFPELGPVKDNEGSATITIEKIK